jgi:hypothetical protein
MGDGGKEPPGELFGVGAELFRRLFFFISAAVTAGG